ncbi:MAG: hypothetical protein IKT62_01990, partial [Firmicutes bacterium]|nr:hypothetical protein [Bacillota bacterium]
MKKFMRPMIALSLILSLLASNAIPVYADTAGVIGSASEKVDTTSWGSSGGSSVYAVSWWGYVVGIQQTKTYKDTLDKAEEYNLNAGELLIYRTFYIDNVKASYTWAANKLFYVLVEGEKAKFGDYAFDPSKYVYMDSLNAAQKAGKSFAAVYNVGTGIKAAQRKSTQNFKTSRGFWPSIAYWEIAPQNAYDRGSWEKDYIELREGTVSESSVKNAMKDQQMYIPGETYKSNINGYTVSYNGYEFGSGWQATGKSNKSGQTKEIDQGVVREQLWEAFQDKQLRIAYIGNSKVYKIYGLGDYAKIEPIYLSSDRVKYAAECLLGCFQDNDGNVANYLEAISDSVKDLNVDSTYHRALRYLDALIAIDYLVGSGSYVDELNYYLSNLNMLEDTDEALTSIVYAPAMTVMRAGSDKSATEAYKEQPRHTFTFNTYYSAIDEGAGVQKGADKVLPQVLLLLNLDAAWWGSGEFPNSDLQYMVKNTSILNKSSKKLKGVSDYEDTAYRALVDYFTSNEL